MEVSDALRKFIREKEEFRSKAYRPVGNDRWTIGFGNTYNKDGTPVQENQTITKPQAMDLCNFWIDRIARGVNSLRAINCNQQRFDAVVSLCYNIGVSQFEKTNTGKMFSAGEDIGERFPKFNLFRGTPLVGLTNRRIAEQKIYKEGVYS